MTQDERIRAVVDCGFTERHARFLVLVMRHGGVCIPRQYAGFAGIANGGRRCNVFFDKPAENNASALIYRLARAGLIDAWVSPAILEDYADVSAIMQNSLLKLSRDSPFAIRLRSSLSSGTNRTTVFSMRSFRRRGIHRHREHGTRARRSRKQSQSVSVLGLASS